MTADRDGELAALYSRVAPDYAEHGPPYFAHAAKRLVELAQVSPGDSVLDLGTGRGAVLLPAAERVGTSGSVLGIDIAPGMVENTNRAIKQLGLVNASVQLMDATQLQLESGRFTHVLSSFSVFFFPDLPRVLHELRRVLRPGGCIAFAFTRGTDPRWTWYEQLLRDAGAFEDLRAPIGYPHIRQTGVLKRLLEQAGFRDAREQEEPTELWFASPEAWWASLWTHGSRRPLERMAPDLLARIQSEAIARVQQMTQRSGVPEVVNFVYVLAIRQPTS